MEQKNRLFDFLYQNLKEQIETGILPYKSALPSMSQLCEIYHVGMRTVREVLKALAQEGMIQTAERKPSRVIYQLTEMSETDSALEPSVRTALKNKSSILSVYETMTILMPPLLAFSAQVCSEEKMQHCLWILEHEKMARRNKWQTYSCFLHEILSASGSLLFRDLYISLELYAHIPFFWEHRDSIIKPEENRRKCSYWENGLLRPENAEEALRYFTGLYRFTTDRIEQYLDRLSLEYPQVQTVDKNIYSWNADLGRDHYYMQIVRDIIDKIGIGIYKDRQFLPSEETLSHQYQVSVATIRKSLSVLNRLVFCKTYNVKGTQVTLFNDDATLSCMKDKNYKKDTLLYLSGLQFMALAVPPAVRLTFDRITEDAIHSLEEKFRKLNAIPLDLIMDCITQQMPLYPFRVILKEVRKLLHWGYYFSFYAEGSQMSNTINQMGLQAFKYLRENDRAAFAKQLSACYCYLLTFVRDFMKDCGLPEAGRIAEPDLSFIRFYI